MEQTIEQIAKAYNKEGVCIPARYSIPAIVQGNDVVVCMFDKNIYCSYRLTSEGIDYCLLGMEK